jgi:hypothetical protein
LKPIHKVIVFFALSIGIGWISNLLRSDYPGKFLEDKIVELLITLLAINVATCGILVSKLDEVSKTSGIDFTPTIDEIKSSLTYQIWLIVVSVICLILFNSQVIKEILEENHKTVFDTVLLTVFICAIDILRDTGMAIFMIKNSKK